MIGSLLFKLGVLKVTKDEAKKLLYEMHDNLADSISQEFSVDGINKNRQKAEIKMFFWFVGGIPLIPKYRDTPFFDVVHNNIYEVIFSEVFEEINSDDSSTKYLSDIYDSRDDFYQKLRKSNNPYELEGLLNSVSKFIYENPFSQSDNLTNDFLGGMMDFGGGMKRTLYIGSLLKNVVPTYSKSMKRLFKLVK